MQVNMVGGAGMLAFRTLLSASAEKQSLATGTSCGAATNPALEKEKSIVWYGMVGRKATGILAPSALGEHLT